MDVLQSGHSINDSQTTVRIDHHAMLILNTLLDLYLDADISIRARTDGFNFPDGADRRLLSGNAPEKSPKWLNGVYAGIDAKRVADMRSVLQAAVNEHKRVYEAATRVPEFMKAPMAVTHSEFGHKQVQPQIEAPLALEAEGWVRELGRDEVETFGFVAYRVSYEESDDKWAAFLRKVERSVELGWDDVVGAENTKRKAMLHWVDGQTVGIAEGDLEGVQRYVCILLYKSMRLTCVDTSIPTYHHPRRSRTSSVLWQPQTQYPASWSHLYPRVQTIHCPILLQFPPLQPHQLPLQIKLPPTLPLTTRTTLLRRPHPAQPPSKSRLGSSIRTYMPSASIILFSL